MIQATILVPTHAERPSLELSLRSALAQTVREIEVFVVGDGCPPTTRELVHRMMTEDTRLRFFDFPKGERHGEAHRHTALQEARGAVVTYLSDDDLLYPDHVEVAVACLKDASFMAPRACFVFPDGSVRNYDGDITSPAWRDVLMTQKRNFIPLTGAAHTMALYRNLDVGWSPAPTTLWTDHFMWRKLIGHPDFRPATAPHVTCIVFPTHFHTAGPDERKAALTSWALSIDDAAARTQLERRLLSERHARACEHALAKEELELRLARCERELAELKATHVRPALAPSGDPS